MSVLNCRSCTERSVYMASWGAAHGSRPLHIARHTTAGGPTMTDIDLSDLAADRDGSRRLRGYLARPAGAGPWPGVVMIHELFGLDDVMRGHADRLAGLGYLTLAVDLFTAGGAR